MITKHDGIFLSRCEQNSFDLIRRQYFNTLVRFKGVNHACWATDPITLLPVPQRNQVDRTVGSRQLSKTQVTLNKGPVGIWQTEGASIFGACFVPKVPKSRSPLIVWIDLDGPLYELLWTKRKHDYSS
jgi:hypothetical protein